MALGSLAENPDSGLKIVPCGMNYFHAHKFRSRAVVEFGTPIDIPRELVEKYKRGERREAVGELLDTIYHALLSVTVNGPDYKTLMVRMPSGGSLETNLTFPPSLSKPLVDCTIPRERNFHFQWLSNSIVV